jgi:hypothetical protein
MIPLMMVLHVRKRNGHFVRLWLPLFLLWLLALPLLILLLPICFVACVIGGVKPFRGIRVFWTLLCAVAGTRIEVDTPRSFVFMHVY